MESKSRVEVEQRMLFLVRDFSWRVKILSRTRTFNSNSKHWVDIIMKCLKTCKLIVCEVFEKVQFADS